MLRWGMKTYRVYIMSNQFDTVYYVGANDLARRVWEHKEGARGQFPSTYRVTKLLYVEAYEEVEQAIQREKQLKGWTRKKKWALIQAQKPEMKDL